MRIEIKTKPTANIQKCLSHKPGSYISTRQNMLRNVGGWIIIITSLIVRSNVKRLHRLRRHLRGQQQIGEGGQRFALDTFVHGPVPVIVEKQKSFSFYRLIHFLHFRGGYTQPYFVNIAWAVIVDAVAISMWLWAFSGVYLWWRRSRRILLGWACLIVGVLSFLGLVLLFCR